MHYNRWKRTGNVEVKGIKSLEERFLESVVKSDGCWKWSGSASQLGYGHVHFGGERLFAHRVSYELHVAPIPAGMHVDHICHNPECSNPAHLRLATPKQNFENRKGADRDSRTGVRGVTKLPSGKRPWAVRIGHNGRKIHVGSFATLAEAEAAAIAKRNELFTHNVADGGVA